MFESMFQSTTIPVLEQVVNFSQARQNVLAGNIANLDTPGYRTRDLSVGDFHARLRQAIETRKQPKPFRSPGEDFSGTRQQAANLVPSDEPSRDGLIAKRLRPGYARNGKALRPELVEVFKYGLSGADAQGGATCPVR